MTDRELADRVWAELAQTTITYDRWRKQGFTPGHWATAKALNDQIGAIVPPPPPPPSGDSYDVPADIDRTGTTDVTTKLKLWIAGVPNGSKLLFNGGTYRIQSMLDITNRSGLTFIATAPTTLKWTTPVTLSGGVYSGDDSLRLLRFGDCSDTAMTGPFTLLGASPMPATGDGFKAWEANVQHMHALAVSRCKNFQIDGITIDGSGGGDGINWGNENQGFRSTGLVRNTIIRNAHRNGISLVGSGGLTVQGGRIERIGAWPIDAEPNNFESSNYNTVFDGITFGSQSGLVSRPMILAFAGNFGGSKDGHGECDGFTVRNCKSVGRPFEIRTNSHDYGGYPYDSYKLRLKNVLVENNSSDTAGSVGEFCMVDGVDGGNNPFTATLRDCTDYAGYTGAKVVV